MNSIQSTKATVRFAFKEPIYKLESSKKQESLIFLFFSSSFSLRFKYSTGYKCCFDNWDFTKQRIKEGKAGLLISREVNELLSRLETSLKKEFARLSAEGIPITADLLKEFLDNITNKNLSVEKNKKLTFFEFVECFIKSKEISLSAITTRAYRQTMRLLKEYEVYSNTKLTFELFDRNFHGNFTQFMESNNYSLNTIGKHVKNLKVFLNNALDDGHTANSKFKSRDFKSRTEETTAIYLNKSEIEAMHNLDLSKHKHLQLARDIFLIGCYTGQRISDYNGLNENCIVVKDKKKFFVIKQQKTKNTVRVPVTKAIQEIMDKRHNGLPPKRMLEQNLNDFIKQVGEELKLNELVKCTSTRGGKELIEMIPKHQLLHSHTARRSFCTNMYLKGMPVYDIMLYSGHRTEREFYKYIRIQDEERAYHVANLGYFDD